MGKKKSKLRVGVALKGVFRGSALDLRVTANMEKQGKATDTIVFAVG